MTAPTKPTHGRAYRPSDNARVTKVTFETNAVESADTAERYSALLMARTVGHLEKVDVGAIVSAYLEEHTGTLFPGCLPASECKHSGDDEPCEICLVEYGPEPAAVAEHLLAATALVETVLDQVRSVLRNRMALDLATTLIPRLKGTRSL
jgi:hypothetical protein